VGKNAQRRRHNKAVKSFLKSIGVPSKAAKLSTLSQEHQTDNPDIIFNRATRRGLGTPQWYKRG
jgi:hypothetical protein